jgi:hypothetical protein
VRMELLEMLVKAQLARVPLARGPTAAVSVSAGVCASAGIR